MRTFVAVAALAAFAAVSDAKELERYLTDISAAASNINLGAMQAMQSDMDSTATNCYKSAQ